MTGVAAVDVQQAHDLIEAGEAVLVDVREPDEFAAARIEGGNRAHVTVTGSYETLFLGIIGVIATMFYLVDVRPKVREITRSR